MRVVGSRWFLFFNVWCCGGVDGDGDRDWDDYGDDDDDVAVEYEHGVGYCCRGPSIRTRALHIIYVFSTSYENHFHSNLICFILKKKRVNALH